MLMSVMMRGHPHAHKDLSELEAEVASWESLPPGSTGLVHIRSKRKALSLILDLLQLDKSLAASFLSRGTWSSPACNLSHPVMAPLAAQDMLAGTMGTCSMSSCPLEVVVQASIRLCVCVRLGCAGLPHFMVSLLHSSDPDLEEKALDGLIHLVDREPASKQAFRKAGAGK
jgi:hypothetical protein